MEITDEQREKIEELSRGMKCSFAFECYKSELELLCDVAIDGSGDILWCKGRYGEEDKSYCSFKLSYGDGFLCRCPIRKYIAQEFDK